MTQYQRTGIKEERAGEHKRKGEGKEPESRKPDLRHGQTTAAATANDDDDD